MMFNTDFAVFYNIETDEEGEPSYHNPHDCATYSTYSVAEGYANVSIEYSHMVTRVLG